MSGVRSQPGSAAPDRLPVGRVPRWALPGELARLDRPGRPRRTVRDWFADLCLFGFAVLMWLFGWAEINPPQPEFAAVVPDWMITVDPWVGAVACLGVWWRRRFPLTFALLMIPAMTVSGTAYGAVMVSLLTVAIHRGPVAAAAVTVAQLAQAVPFTLQYQPPGLTVGGYLLIVLLSLGAPLGWGIAVRARRQLTMNLRREAERERQDHQHRLVAARRAERTRIAREMHDVLAHRISLLSVHAGALAYRTDRAREGAGTPLSGAEVMAAVTVIRDAAHQALIELGEVLTVLRSDDAGEAAEGASGAGRQAPQPRLADLDRLVREATDAGQRVRLAVALADGPEPRAQEQRTVYRVVQEGLTNARKHAPDARVEVTVDGEPGRRLTARVRNPLPVGVTAVEIPGAGSGLTGLAERVALDGGSLAHGAVDGAFELTATLPWRM